MPPYGGGHTHAANQAGDVGHTQSMPRAPGVHTAVKDEESMHAHAGLSG